VETIFNHIGEEMSLFPGLFLMVSTTTARLEQLPDILMDKMQLLCNLYFFFHELMVKLLMIKTNISENLNYQ
jgi:hypothetical protein